ncbi:MAG: YitT family protein [Oscillospiraceae bacterium]|nr:YitT family protein [Oscillospiraceae bacterium]
MKLKFHGLWWDLTRILVGSFIAAFSFRFFTFPNNIVSGGITGIAQILNLLLKLPVGASIVVMNIPLFIWAGRKLGRRFVILTGICMFTNSVFIDLLEPIAKAVTNDPMLSAVYGGVLNGLGYGIVFTTGATSGGTDIPARFLRRKFPHINFSTFLLGLNVVIILAFAIIFRRFESCMYTAICMFIANKVEALILYGPVDSRLCYIISDKSEDLRHALTEQLGRGVTLLQGQGAWSGKEKQVILCVVKPIQIGPLRRMVRAIDVNAFLVIGDARSVYGRGFESITTDD